MNNNAIAFTGLCSEYCANIARAYELTTRELTATMLKLLPRIYICALDLKADVELTEEAWIEPALSEDEYNDIRNNLCALFGQHDVYLEVFEEDMKYSDTPVSASIAENLADIYQALFDYLNTVRFGTDEVTAAAVNATQESFKEYWSATLCNVLRALNNLWAHDLIDDDDDNTTSADTSSLD